MNVQELMESAINGAEDFMQVQENVQYMCLRKIYEKYFGELPKEKGLAFKAMHKKGIDTVVQVGGNWWENRWDESREEYVADFHPERMGFVLNNKLYMLNEIRDYEEEP